MSQRSKLTHPNLTVHRYGDFVPPRKWYQLSGLGQRHELGVHNSTIEVLERALLERAFYCETRPGVFEPALGSSDTDWEEMGVFGSALDRYNGRHWHPQSATDVVAYYTGAKKELYERARQSLIADPVLHNGDCVSKVFAKFEKANLGKAPRCIQPRDPRYNVLVGKYIKQIEHRIYRSIAKVFNKSYGGDQPTVIKGYNTRRTAAILHAKWGRFADPICIGLDAKKFDMHVSAAALRFEHDVYLRMYRGDPKLCKLLRKQITNSGKGYCKDGRLKFDIEGIRFSGDMNTALGNCIIMCALVWTWAKRVGVTIELGNNGDDCVIFCERKDEDKFTEGLQEWFNSKGFRMDVEATVDDFEAVEFCQSHPVWNGADYVMCRSMTTALIKDSMCLISLDTSKTFENWCAAVGMCGGSLSTGVPVMQSFYRAFRRSGMNAKPSKGFIASIYKNTGQFERMSKADKTTILTGDTKVRVGTLSYEVREIEARSRLSFWIAHGITPDDQINLEKYFDSYSIKWPVSKEISSAQIKDTIYIEYPQN